MTSHEILNSLAPVSSCAQTAKALVTEIIEGDIKDPGLQEDMRDIHASLDNRSAQKRGSGQVYPELPAAQQNAATEEIKKLLFPQYFQHVESLIQGELAKKGINIKFAHDPPSLSVLADEDMLDQMLINLIRNAADEQTRTDTLSIWVSGHTDRKQRTVLEVKDNGPGIAAEAAEKIFVPFFTTKAHGSGIGLALIRYMMLSHGGTVTYFPNEYNGSSFRLVF